jgi:hypothetical protein
MSRRTTRSESGVVGIILTLVIVFALVAVVELTRTLQAAQDINVRVVDITTSVSGADKHLNTGCDQGQGCSTALPALSQTGAIVAQIDIAAKPLAGEVGQIVTAVDSINATASQILSSARSINATVHSINGVAASINGSAKSIAGNIDGINATAIAIRGAPVPGSALPSGVIGINNRADTVIAFVNAIKGDTGTINAQAQGILTQARGISCDKVLRIVGPLSGTC